MTHEQKIDQQAMSSSSPSTSSSSCSSGNNSSSSLIFSNSFTNPKQQQQQQSQPSQGTTNYDIGTIMNDLKIASATLTLVARQMDQVVGKIDQKFSFIFENLAQQQHQYQSQSCTNEILSNTPQDFINCLKRTTNNLNQMSSANRNFTKIIKNEIIKTKHAAPSAVAPVPPVVPVAGTSSSSSLSSSCSNKSQNNSIQSDHKNTKPNREQKSNRFNNNEYAALNNLIANNNNDFCLHKKVTQNPTRATMSDRKASVSALLSNFVGLQMNNGNQHKSNSLKVDESNCNIPTWNDNQNSTFLSNNRQNNLVYNPYGNGSLTTKVKCTRSKSQPVFNKDSLNIDTSSSTYGCTTSFKVPQTTSNINTSSPICNEISPSLSMPNEDANSSNPESSFYEDQLDNELESFSDSTGITANTAKTTTLTNKTVKIIDDQSINSGGIKNQLKPKLNSNHHHVSFNINNAIYTSRQETPIPISILKQSISNRDCTKSILANTTNSSASFDHNHNFSNQKAATQLQQKSVRSDSKTTVL